MIKHFLKNGRLGFVPPEIDNYAAAMSAPESELRKLLAEETREKTSDPVMMIGPQEAALLQVLILATRARRIVEVGTFTGYSALAMWEVRGADVRGDETDIITLEADGTHAAIAERYFRKADPYGLNIRLLFGDAHTRLLDLKLGAFDLAFIDAEKTGYIDYWQKCKKLVRKGGLLIADNTLSCKRKKACDPDGTAIAAFNEFVSRDRDVHVAFTTIRDGMTIAYVK